MTFLPQADGQTPWDEAVEELRRLAGAVEVDAAAPWLREHWLAWRSLTRFLRFSLPEGGSYLAVWLERPVEEAVDKEWATSPSRAFLLDRLAAGLCMRELRRCLPALAKRPEAKEADPCAPLPPLTAALLAALRQAGLAADGEAPLKAGAAPLLARRYAVLTYDPARGCGACVLRPGCPRLRA